LIGGGRKNLADLIVERLVTITSLGFKRDADKCGRKGNEGEFVVFHGSREL
jgi:hypothetical protein